jgi:hypothetical protein
MEIEHVRQALQDLETRYRARSFAHTQRI